MRQILLITGGAILVLSLTIGGFALNQANQEEIELSSRLQSRTIVLAESLSEAILPTFRTGSTSTLDTLVNRFVSNERLVGLVVFKNDGTPLAESNGLPASLVEHMHVEHVMDSNEADGTFVRNGADNLYLFTHPLSDDNRVIGALSVVQNANYIDAAIQQIWINNVSRLLLQVVLFALTIFLVLRIAIMRPIHRMTDTMRSLRTGTASTAEIHHGGLWAPLSSEISKMTTSLKHARSVASEEARLRLEKLDTPWTAERLKEFIKAYLKDRPIYVVSNREPYVHEKTKNGIVCSVPASGVISAFEPIMDACGGMWFAHGSGSADKETADAEGKIRVPTDEPRYTLQRIWLTEEEVRGHYTGFSNEAFWPLCHMAHTRPNFREQDWEQYTKVNGIFAETILAEIKNVQRPIILIQDFHFALLPAMIKKARPDAQIAIFWHVPWPSAETFSICPWRKEILEGMLGADIIGFHTQQFCTNFIDTVGAEIEALIDFDTYSVTRNGRQSFVKSFPISIAFTSTEKSTVPRDPSVFKKFGITTPLVGLGVDRLDYAKGILERFKGVEFLLQNHPEYRERFTFLQVSSPSRESVEKYREYADHVTREADRINAKFGTKIWKPIVLEKKHHAYADLIPLYRNAHLCLITSLHDGMNLVAKEFAAARDDEEGVLILSQFTGASRDMKGAIIINPYSAEETSEAMHTALTMPPEEQRRRMKSMRASIVDFNVYRWAAELLKAIAKLD